MARLLRHPHGADTKLTCGDLNSTEIPVHSSIIAARSNVLAEMILPVSEPTAKRNPMADAAEDKISDTRDPQEERMVDKGNGRLEVCARRYSIPALKHVRTNLL